ncbi:hypothetical protein CJP72_14675 [Citrobacter sp. NCU1]|nr:hypothetical protein [Citrobacter sp. NCU1]
MLGWAENIASGERLLINNPEYFSAYMREQLQAQIFVEHAQEQ